MSLSGVRGIVYGLFATIVLSTLWVTSLTMLSARPSATALITDAGSDILNPFLVAHGTGLSQPVYVKLEADAKAHPSRPLAIPLVKVPVPGSAIAGDSYSAAVRVVYGRVADTYYTQGAGAVFDVPPQLRQVLPDFALFNPDNIPVIPGGPKVAQLPPVLQPFFVFVGLTPDTFTQSGHQRLANLLPWFWLLTGILGALAIILNSSEKKLAGLAHAIIHTTWPVITVLVALWVLSLMYRTRFAPYADALAVIRGAFLPVYGIALVVGLAGLGLTSWLPALRNSQRADHSPATIGALPPTVPPAEGQA